MVKVLVDPSMSDMKTMKLQIMEKLTKIRQSVAEFYRQQNLVGGDSAGGDSEGRKTGGEKQCDLLLIEFEQILQRHVMALEEAPPQSLDESSESSELNVANSELNMGDHSGMSDTDAEEKITMMKNVEKHLQDVVRKIKTFAMPFALSPAESLSEPEGRNIKAKKKLGRPEVSVYILDGILKTKKAIKTSIVADIENESKKLLAKFNILVEAARGPSIMGTTSLAIAATSSAIGATTSSIGKPKSSILEPKSPARANSAIQGRPKSSILDPPQIPCES